MADDEVKEDKSNGPFKLASVSLVLLPPKPEAEVPASRSPKQTSSRTVLMIGERFATRLQLLWTFVTKIGSVAQATSVTNAAMLMALISEMKGRSTEDGKDALVIAEVTLELVAADGTTRSDTARVPVSEPRRVKTLNDYLRFNDAAMRILHETAVQQLVNGYEQLMADMVRRHIMADTKAASRERTITYRELLEYGSLEEAQRKVVEAQVTEFVRGNSTVEHLSYLKKELGLDVRQSFPEVDGFRELVLRRHAIVHAGGLVTAEYLRRAREIVGTAISGVEGEPLDLEPSYIAANWDRTYAMGIITSHIAGQAEARRQRDIEVEESVDYFLVNAAFWALQNHRYHAAELVLAYASRLHLCGERCQRMVDINLAQALKWQGREDDCRAELDRHDWSASSSLFRLGAEVLRDGPDIERHMRGAVADAELSAEDLYTWPVFKALRERPDFGALMTRVFGAAATDRADEFEANFLDLDYQKTFTRLREMGQPKKGDTEGKGPEPAAPPEADPTVH